MLFLLLFLLCFRVLDRGGDFFSLGGAETTRGRDFFSGPLGTSFRPKRDIFYVTLVLLSRGNYQAHDRGQNGAEQREQESASLNYEPLLGRERNSSVGDLAKCDSVLSQFKRVTACQLDVSVQDV